MRYFHTNKLVLTAIVIACSAGAAQVWADAGIDVPSAASYDSSESSGNMSQQYGTVETLPVTANMSSNVARASSVMAADQNPNTKSYAFPTVQTPHDEEMANRFSWWPTDAKPGPVKDDVRSGYWWWPEIPGEARPWGNQGFVYVRKIIFDYKTSEGESKPSLVIKKVLKNVKVYFDYDKSGLRQDAVDALDQAIGTLNRNPQADILVTGNADVRGSESYNFKLAERRAASVRDYLLQQGVEDSRIRILSRGKLDALAPRGDIVGMQKDRNAQFMIAEVEEIMIPADKAALFQDRIIEETKSITGDIKATFKEYEIQKGDTLWGIAEREYGNGRQWKRIYDFNKDVIANPDRPKRGTVIRIPIE